MPGIVGIHSTQLMKTVYVSGAESSISGFDRRNQRKLEGTHATVLPQQSCFVIHLRDTRSPPRLSPLPSILTYPPIKCHVQMFKPSLQCPWQVRACGLRNPQSAGEESSIYRKAAHACKKHTLLKGHSRGTGRDHQGRWDSWGNVASAADSRQCQCKRQTRVRENKTTPL